MNTLETLNKRKSVRSYTEEPVSDNDLTTILECAWCSPVGMKQYDSLRLTVIKNQELLESIEENARTFMHKEDYKPLYGAKTLIIVSSNQVLENHLYNYISRDLKNGKVDTIDEIISLFKRFNKG